MLYRTLLSGAFNCYVLVYVFVCALCTATRFEEVLIARVECVLCEVRDSRLFDCVLCIVLSPFDELDIDQTFCF